MQRITVDFWNVGQGDASSISRPDGKMDVIDVGPSDGLQLCEYLKNYPCIISNLVLTHNDNDHIGALETLLDNPHLIIENAYIVIDRDELKRNPVFKKLKKRAQNLFRAETNGEEDKVIDEFGDYKLVLKYPDFQANFTTSRPNGTSTILALTCQDKDVIIWGADNKISTIKKHVAPQMPMLFGPHHGAPEDNKQKSFPNNVAKLSPRQCFLSFGYDNQYRHPSREYIDELNKAECRIICSHRHKSCKATKLPAILDGDAYYSLLAIADPNIKICHGHVRLIVEGCSAHDELEKEYAAAKQKVHRRRCKV